MAIMSIQQLISSMGLTGKISIISDVLGAAATTKNRRFLRREVRTEIGRDTINLAFVTDGDTRPILDNRDRTFNPAGVHTSSAIWQRRAEDLPKIFDGVELDDLYPEATMRKVQIESVFDVDGADKVINDLPSELRLRNVFFLGHGSSTHGFIFSGEPSGPDILDALEPHGKTTVFKLSLADAANAKFKDRNTRFLQSIRARLAPGYIGIWFLSCFTGLSELPRAVTRFLRREGRREFLVGAYENFYRVNARGRLRGNTEVKQTIAGSDETFRVPVLRRFVRWNDQILDDKMNVVGRSHANRVPRFEVLDGHGQLPMEPGVLTPRDPSER